MTSSAPATVRRRVAIVGAVIAATAAVSALVGHGVAASAGVAPPPVAVFSPADAAVGAAAIVPVAVPTTTCAGSYLSTQPAGAAGPAVRSPTPGGP